MLLATERSLGTGKRQLTGVYLGLITGSKHRGDIGHAPPRICDTRCRLLIPIAIPNTAILQAIKAVLFK
jgi:hypothetical protein